MASLVSKRERKKRLAGSNRELGKPGYSIVSYCPECPRLVSPSDPERDEHVNVDLRTRTATCSRGHSWKVR